MEDILEVVRASCADQPAADANQAHTNMFVEERMYVEEEQQEQWGVV